MLSDAVALFAEPQVGDRQPVAEQLLGLAVGLGPVPVARQGDVQSRELANRRLGLPVPEQLAREGEAHIHGGLALPELEQPAPVDGDLPRRVHVEEVGPVEALVALELDGQRLQTLRHAPGGLGRLGGRGGQGEQRETRGRDPSERPHASGPGRVRPGALPDTTRGRVAV